VSVIVEEDFKRWTAKRKAALVMEIIQGKTSIAEASRSYDLPPSEIEEWVEEDKRGILSRLPWRAVREPVVVCCFYETLSVPRLGGGFRPSVCSRFLGFFRPWG
jgi:hypothetical protein